MVDVTAYLQSRGVSYQTLGALGNPDFTQAGLRLPNEGQVEAPFYGAKAAQFNAEAAALISGATGTVGGYWDSSQEGGPVWIPAVPVFLTGPFAYPEQTTPQALLAASQGAAAIGGSDAVTHASGLLTGRFGGPLWYMFARLGLQNTAPTDWLTGQPTSPLTLQYDPWAIARNMTPEQIAQILSEIYVASLTDLGAGTTATGSVGGSPGAGTPGPSGE
jgi:hypothetical protein